MHPTAGRSAQVRQSLLNWSRDHQPRPDRGPSSKYNLGNTRRLRIDTAVAVAVTETDSGPLPTLTKVTKVQKVKNNRSSLTKVTKICGRINSSLEPSKRTNLKICCGPIGVASPSTTMIWVDAEGPNTPSTQGHRHQYTRHPTKVHGKNGASSESK